jgi:hypothetical protein
VSLEVTLPDVGGARLQDTACHYVSGDGDEQSTTVRDIRLDAVAEGQACRPIRSLAGQHHYPGLFWSVTTGKHVWYESLLAVARRAGVSRTFLYTNPDAKTAGAVEIRQFH